MRKWPALALAVLAGCGRAPTVIADDDRGHVLETAAIEAGVIADPDAVDVTGLYARDDDRLCIVPAARDFRVGVRIELGDQSCAGAGTLVRQSGERVSLDLGRGCAFDAAFEGDRITFPADLPARCASLCGERGTMAAATLDRLSDAPAEAATLTLRQGAKPCG